MALFITVLQRQLPSTIKYLGTENYCKDCKPPVEVDVMRVVNSEAVVAEKELITELEVKTD